MPDKAALKQSLETICAEITPDNAFDKQSQFSEYWKKYVLDNGYDEFAEETLIDGYLCNSINYWKDVWKKQEDGDAFFEKLLSGKIIRRNGKGSRVVLLGALSICINELDTAGKFIGKVLQLLGNILPEISDFDLDEFEERFLKRVKERQLDELDLNISSKSKKVLKFFKEVRKFYPDGNLEGNTATERKTLENRNKLDFVISLLSGSKKKQNEDSLPEKKVEKKDDSVAKAEKQSPEDELQSLRKKYKTLSETKKKLEVDVEEYHALLKKNSAEWMDAEKRYKSQIDALQKSLENRRLEIAQQNGENQNLKKEIERVAAELEQKESVIQEKDRSIRILKESRDDRYEEKMKSIRDRLAIYYGAFQDCRDQQMSEDLGHVMRGYLNDVFEIIMDNEMNLNQQ